MKRFLFVVFLLASVALVWAQIVPVTNVNVSIDLDGGNPVAITFSHVQSAGAANTDPAVVTLTGGDGNLLIAAMMERSGGAATSHTITGSGWTKRVERTIQQGDSTHRRSLSVWTKVAGASEPTTITFDDGSANNKTAVVGEYSHGSGTATWTFEASASNDNGATFDGTTISSGTTASVGAGDLLKLAIGSIKRDATTSSTSGSWSNSFTEHTAIGDGVNYGSQLNSASMLTDTSSGTKETTLTISSNVYNTGLAGAILVFSAAEGGGAMAPPLMTPAIRAYQHLAVR